MTTSSASKTVAVRVRLSLRIVGDDVDPVVISDKLSLKADRSHRKGDLAGRSGVRTHPKGLWVLDSAEHVPKTEPFDRHAVWLLDRIEPIAHILREWAQTDWVVDLFVGVFTDEGHGGPTVTSAVLRRLGDLGLDLQWDLYPGDADG